ncbi:S8 family serine peptidase [Flavobacteriales bacterium]|nr:S8 family serine peptidase [Flavobacteriales bacterium]
MLDSVFENQLYIKLNSLDNISESSWKLVESSPNNINSTAFPFGEFLDSIGLINIKQPFGIKKEAEKLYLTFLVEFTDQNHDLNKLIKKLNEFVEVDYSEPKFKDFEDYLPNDPSYSSCWHLDKIQANLAWELGIGSSDIVVSIVDDAITVNHPDLQNVIWVNPNEIPNNGIDDDNNGYIDDINGWDTYTNDNDPSPHSNTPAWAHGTHCAGIAGAHTDNNIGISAIGFGVSLMAVKTADNNGLVNQTWDGVYYSIVSGADVISCSWSSGSYSQTNNNIIEFGINNGSIIVAASGNNGANLASNPKYPACYNGVICVANTTSSDIKAGSSNYGTRVDLGAPGSSILSTIPYSGYGTKTGTSMSAPMVAGLLGLMKSFSPNTSNEQLINCMKNSCDNIDALNPSYIGLLGSGRINAYQALLCLSPPNADFTINNQDTCSGEIQFYDATLGVPKSWAWDFDGDGIIDDTSNTARVYFNQSGSYNTSLTVSNDYGTDTKTVQNAFNITLSDAPLIDNLYSCTGDTISLKTNNYNNLNWYINENDFDEISSGLELITEPIYNDTSFFVSELSDTSCYSTGLNYFPNNGSTSSNYSYLLFDVFRKMTLKSVDVKSIGNQDRTIIILDSSNQIIFEKTFNNFNTGIHTLNLNATLFQGNNYKIGLSTTSTVNLYRANSGANFPYEIPGLISITKSVINPINTSTQQYYYFFNWIVCDPVCESKRSEVKIFTDDCENIQDLQDIVVFPNPNSGIFTIRVPKNQYGSLMVVNMLGQIVYENSFYAVVEKVFVNIPNLSKGIYNLSVIINNQTIIKKFTIIGE